MSKPKANKDLGQHYLRDQKVIQTICHDFDDVADVIVEVGPGPISLTKTLSTLDLPLYVIERDQRFEELLRSCVESEKIFFQDALKFDWENFIKDQKLESKKVWLVSNLPYNVSVPLLMSFMKVPQIQFMTLMFQKEVGDKTFLRQDVKNQMGSLVALCENYFKTKSLIKVPPGAFAPPPKVNSIVVRYERRERPTISLHEFEIFENFLRSLFQFKRKQLGGVLKKIFENQSIEEILNLMAISPQIRAESLTLEQVIALYKAQTSAL